MTRDGHVSEATLQALFDAFNRHDSAGVVALMTEDCVFEGAAGPDVYGVRFIGRAAVAAAFEGVWATFPDARWDVSRHLVLPDRGVSEWTFRGTRADNRRSEAEGVDLFAFAGGLIAHKRAFRKERPLLP